MVSSVLKSSLVGRKGIPGDSQRFLEDSQSPLRRILQVSEVSHLMLTRHDCEMEWIGGNQTDVMVSFRRKLWRVMHFLC